MKHLLLAAIALLATLSPSPAQRPPRIVDTYDSAWVAAGPEEWQLDTSGQLSFGKLSAAEAAEAPSSISLPGGFHSSAAGKCLLCGTNASGDGVVESWMFSPPSSLVLLDSRLDAGTDYVGVAHDGANGMIYLLDAANSRILRGSWDGQAPLSAVSLSVYAAGSQVAELNAAAHYTLSMNSSGALTMLNYPVMGRRSGYLLSVTGSSLSLSTLVNTGPSHPAYAIPELSSEGASTVSVRAVSGVAFQIVRSSNGGVVGGGVGQGAATIVTVPTSEPLVLGERYSAHVPGSGSSAAFEFECVRRYGQSESLSDGTTMTPFFYQRGATAGSIFNIQLALRSMPQPIDRSYESYLLVAFRLPSDPVVQIGQGYVLNTSTMFPATGWIPADFRGGTISLDVPIPAGLGGLVFLVQYCVVDGNQLKLSQIYGSAIE